MGGVTVISEEEAGVKGIRKHFNVLTMRGKRNIFITLIVGTGYALSLFANMVKQKNIKKTAEKWAEVDKLVEKYKAVKA